MTETSDSPPPAPPAPAAPPAPPAPSVGLTTEERYLRLHTELRLEQSLAGAAIGGLLAAAVGAAAWAAIAVGTGYMIGWVAIGIGFIVGLAVRHMGKGIDGVYGVVGGAFALLGVAAGNLLAVCVFVAKQEGVELLEVLGRLDVSTAQRVLTATFEPMDALFYGIAIYEGYKLSFRQLSPEELDARLERP